MDSMSQYILLLLHFGQGEFLSLATRTALLNIAPVAQSSVSSERQIGGCDFMARWKQGQDGRWTPVSSIEECFLTQEFHEEWLPCVLQEE